MLDQCAVGGMLEGQYIRKRSQFQSDMNLKNVDTQCPGGHQHLHLRGHGRTAAAAQYTEEECRRICLDCPASGCDTTAEGGRFLPVHSKTKSCASSEIKFVIEKLHGLAIEKNLQDVWNAVANPWLESVKLLPWLESVRELPASAVMSTAVVASGVEANDLNEESMAQDGRPVHQDDSLSPSAGGRPVHQYDNLAVVDTEYGDAKKKLGDLVSGEIKEAPWQHKKYQADNAHWQAAALRKRAHHRRTNKSLGVATVDLSGMLEPTPRPGGRVTSSLASIFSSLGTSG